MRVDKLPVAVHWVVTLISSEDERVLFRQGEQGDEFFILLHGRAEVRAQQVSCIVVGGEGAEELQDGVKRCGDDVAHARRAAARPRPRRRRHVGRRRGRDAAMGGRRLWRRRARAERRAKAGDGGGVPGAVLVAV